KLSTLGTKRNNLTKMAKGTFVSFVDDDDDVADDYVAALLGEIRRNKVLDCIVFNARIETPEQPVRLCKYGIEYDDVNFNDVFYRRPNQVCCFRREVAVAVPREDVTWGEDTAWARAVRPRLERQVRIDRPLYIYHDCRQKTECDPPSSPRQIIEDIAN